MQQGLDSLLTQIEGESKEITTRIVSTIREEVPLYADFALENHKVDVQGSVAAIIVGVRDHHLPSARALEHARVMGRDRARFGVPLRDAITGYHIGYRELWNVLLARARRHRPDLTAELAQEVTLLWEWFQRLSSAFAAAHDAERRIVHIDRLAAGQRLVGALLDDASGSEQRDDLLGALGYDPGGEFVVACAALRGDRDVARLNGILGQAAGSALCAAGPSGHTVIVTQNLESRAVLSAVQELFPKAVAAVGLRRRGSAGAAASLEDALEAVGHAERTGQALDYESDWLLSVVASRVDRLRPLFAIGIRAAEEHPALAQTVTAYLRCRQSTAACAREMFMHPNSVKYRLQRWTELTGWDLHSVDGLVRSSLALRLTHPGVVC